jgi:tripartite-type tricarboxylate transporter receptor subunit TctC
MPGVGGAKAAQYIASVAPMDGTQIGAISPGAIVGPLLDTRAKVGYDPRTLIYLASANSGTRVCVTSAQSKAKTFQDAQQSKTIMGTAGEGDSTQDYALLHKATAGAQFSIVTGYSGTRDIALAMERGELDGVCGWDWASLKSQEGNLIRDGKLNIIVQDGLHPDPELTKRGVPEIWPFLASDDDRKVNELIFRQQLFSRPFVAPPGVPAVTVKLLRDAFSKMMHDKAFLADAVASRIDIAPLGGQDVQDAVTQMYSAPKAIVEQARRAIGRS